MDEQLRRQITRIILAGLALCLIIYASGRRGEINRLRHQIAYGSPVQRLAAVNRLIETQKLQEAVANQPRWIQDYVVEAVSFIGTEKALFQLMSCWTVVDAPVQPRIQAVVARFGALAIPPLVEALTDKDAAVRAGAPGVLTAIGEPTIPYLLPLMGAWDDYIRTGVATVFGGIGKPVTDELVKIIQRGEPRPGQESAEYNRERDCAITSLLNMKINAVEAITKELLVYKTADVRGQAATMLGTIGAGLKPEEAPQVVGPLIAATKDADWGVRRKATAALGAMGALALLHNATPVLMARLDDAHMGVRQAAAEALGKVLGADVREAAAKLAAPPPPTAPASPATAATATGAAAPAVPPPPDPKTYKLAEAKAAAEKMAAMLIANVSGASREISTALIRIGALSVAPLKPALASPNPEVRLLATQTVAQIGGPEAIVFLAAALRDTGSPEVRQVASDALRNASVSALVAAAQQVLPALAAALTDDKWQVYYAARDALAKIGAPAVPTLLKALAHPQVRVGHMAQMALTRIGAPAVPGLVQSLLTGNEQVRKWASLALGEIGEPAVAPLSHLLANPAAPAAARASAASALGATGMASALQPLQKAAGAPEASVRIAALRALARLGYAEATENLVAGLQDKQREVRDVALALLKNWRMDPVQKLLQELLNKEDTDAKRRAAIALVFQTASITNQLLREVAAGSEAAQQQLQQSLPPVLVEAALDDAAPRNVRTDALIALGFVADEQAIDKIKALLQPNEPLALPAAKAIAMIGVRRAASLGEGVQKKMGQAGEMLISLVTAATTDPQLRLAAATALANMQDIPVDSLIEQLDSPDEQTRVWAAAILAAIGKPATEKALRARGEAKRSLNQRQWLASTLQIIGDAMALQLMKHLPEPERPQPSQVRAIEEKLELIRQAQTS